MKQALAIITGLIFFIIAPAEVRSQSFQLTEGGIQALVPSDGIVNNAVSNLHAEGDTLWVGPFLNTTSDGGMTWFVSDEDSLRGSRNRIFSIDVEGTTIWLGLGYIDDASGDGFQSAAGFLFSEDAGQTFQYRPPQLDVPGDTEVQYGVSTLEALDVIVPQQSPPFDIDYDPVNDEVWVAGWASGIRRSTDAGQSWDRVVLPPDTLDFISPDSTYDFKLEPRRGTLGWLNHMGFAVLVDDLGTVWAGTPNGVNRSDDGGLSWRKSSADGSDSTLTGSWVISIEEQPLPDTNAIWMATWNAGEAGEQGVFGITVTRDQGQSFQQVLRGERILDFAFAEGIVYAAGDNGLFITRDDGITWTTVRSFNDPGQPDRLIRPDARVLSVATIGNELWAGTTDGLVKSLDQGATWKLFRVEVPLHPDEPSDAVPDVDVFAYPNPFSPVADQFVRIRYELDTAASPRIRVFDFGMTLVREIDIDSSSPGIRESVWDGKDSEGLRVANGTYFYVVEAAGDTFWGKILVLE
ncbi:MAG: hypothetical protein HKN43_04565 [Rhodothermales bacterium]|nr:hypothetical protein [Rhodothermales bacterium]